MVGTQDMNGQPTPVSAWPITVSLKAVLLLHHSWERSRRMRRGNRKKKSRGKGPPPGSRTLAKLQHNRLLLLLLSARLLLADLGSRSRITKKVPPVLSPFLSTSQTASRQTGTQRL